jgi:hypothetical protein
MGRFKSRPVIMMAESMPSKAISVLYVMLAPHWIQADCLPRKPRRSGIVRFDGDRTGYGIPLYGVTNMSPGTIGAI